MRSGTLALLGALAVLLLGGGGASARAAAPKPVPPSFPHTVRTQPLNLAVAGPRAVMVAVASGYCSGDPFRPAIARVGMRWTRLSNGRFRAVLTAFVREPKYEPVVDPDPGDDVVYNACAGLGLYLKHRVVLPRRLAEVQFFDGSQAPARRVPVSKRFLSR